MRYAMCIADGETIVGTRGEITAALAGAMLATGYDSKDPTAWKKADFVLNMADIAADEGKTQGLSLFQEEFDHDQEVRVWRERGDLRKNRDYLVRVGGKSTPFRTGDTTVLLAYITALMVGDGVHIDRAASLGELVAHTLSEGGSYPDHEVTELKDGRRVYAWWEGEK